MAGVMVDVEEGRAADAEAIVAVVDVDRAAKTRWNGREPRDGDCHPFPFVERAGALPHNRAYTT